VTASRAWHTLMAAIQFLTRVPVPGGMNRTGAETRTLTDAVVFFPLVGAAIGLLTGTIIWLGLHIWPAMLAAALGLGVEALVTGGFHEDAVADSCDAFGGAWTREDVLRILKDSRGGSFGTLGLILAVALRLLGLAALDPVVLVTASTASAAIGRWCILLLMAAVPPVPRREGLAKDVGQRIGGRSVVLGALLTVPGIAWYAWLRPRGCGFAVAASLIVIAVWAWYVRRRLGGFTGDCLGAGCYAVQVVVILVAAAL